MVGRGGEKQIHTFSALFCLECLATINTNHLGWKEFSSPFVICQVRILLPGGPQGDGVSRFPCLQNPLSGDGGLRSSASLLCPKAGPSFTGCQSPKPDCCLCPSGLPCAGCILTFHCYRICAGVAGSLRMHVASVSVLTHIPSHLFTSIRPPSDFSTHRSLRCVYVLSRES